MKRKKRFDLAMQAQMKFYQSFDYQTLSRDQRDMLALRWMFLQIHSHWYQRIQFFAWAERSRLPVCLKFFDAMVQTTKCSDKCVWKYIDSSVTLLCIRSNLHGTTSEHEHKFRCSMFFSSSFIVNWNGFSLQRMAPKHTESMVFVCHQIFFLIKIMSLEIVSIFSVFHHMERVSESWLPLYTISNFSIKLPLEQFLNITNKMHMDINFVIYNRFDF